jgi:sugar/nucleoside kinase (ribokinase family)
MSDIRYDVVGIGNAIVDIIGRCDDAFLARHGAEKGSMRLVDTAAIQALYGEMGPAVQISGGSVANTMAGIASFGARSAFIGKIADDEFGRIFAHDIRSVGVDFAPRPTKSGEPTARSLILVTPDGQRTMNTFLGISVELDESDIDPDLVRSAGVLYLEGYLFDRPKAKAAFRHAAEIASKAGRRVALTLSDGFCVDRHRAEFLEFIRSRVDILFANENEITALYQTSSFEEAARQVVADTKIAALTRSAKGSEIRAGQDRVVVPADPIATVVDTTGAGDLYAAGLLYGLATGRGLDLAGRLGSLAAAEIISHVGARPQVGLGDLARKKGIIR